MKTKWLAAILLLTACAAAQSGDQRTSLFGTTLGKPNPSVECHGFVDAAGALTPADPGCGLGVNADSGPYVEPETEDGPTVGLIYATWFPVMCSRVQVALVSKFGTPAVGGWHGTNGLGLPISGTMLTWKRKNGDKVRFASPDPRHYPDCYAEASSAKFRARPEEKNSL
jgi:hypothetical protein